MSKDLRITIIQTSLFWEDAVKNIKLLNKTLSVIKKGTTDVIVLPEMFPTGFSMDAVRLAEQVDGLSMQWMRETAMALNAAICGSIIIKEKNKFYNRLIWMNPDGSYESYNKRHLFRMAGEHKIYSGGKKRLIVNYKGWKICPLVCYDLRFPAWSRNSLQQKSKGTAYDFDVLIYVANWPAIRTFPWSQLLVARAIENQVYVAGVNRIGKDDNNIPYNGSSVVLDMFGSTISKTKPNKTSVETITLSHKALSEARIKFPVLLDADKVSIKN